MSIFNTLGSALGLPKATDFSSATITQKVGELGTKLASTGLAPMFDQATVSRSNIAPEMQDAIENLMDAKTGDYTSPTQLPASSAETNELKVIISQEPIVGDDNVLVFDVMPKIDESRAVEYEQIIPIHHPGAIQKYRNTSTRKWSVAGRLISRTTQEASRNLRVINMIRSWTQPFYGNGTAKTFAEILGAPPPILTLKAYGPSMIGPVKCVLTNYSWSFDNTLDYIPTDTGNPFPVILDVSLQLDEAYSPAEYSGFDLVKFKQGDLSSSGAFEAVSAPIPPPTMAPDPTEMDVLASMNAGRGIRGGPTAEELSAYSNAQFQAKAAAANMVGTQLGPNTQGGAGATAAAILYRKPVRRAQ